MCKWTKQTKKVTEDDVPGYLSALKVKGSRVTHKIAKFDKGTPNVENKTGRNIPWNNRDKRHEKCGYRFFLENEEELLWRGQKIV